MGVVERYFEALRAHDWEALAGCLADDVERTGPYLDVVRGRQAYVSFLASVLPSLPNYELRLFAVHALGDGSALALLSETLDVEGARTEFPEAIVFGIDADGRIDRVSVYIQRPPAGAG